MRNTPKAARRNPNGSLSPVGDSLMPKMPTILEIQEPKMTYCKKYNIHSSPRTTTCCRTSRMAKRMEKKRQKQKTNTCYPLLSTILVTTK